MTSPYGVAGSLVVFVIWVYYSAQILFFGAEFTQVFASTLGSRIEPSPNAMPLSAAAKAEQGVVSEAARENAAREQRGRDGRLAST